MKTITFKTWLIGKALFSIIPANQELWERKQTKIPRLDRGECASFPDLDYQALGILDSVLSLAQTQPQLVLYHPEKKTSYSASEYAAQQNNFKKDRATLTQRASCFLPGIKAAAVDPCGSLQGVGPTTST